ncbi:GNAT family N-acetyltransferase [Flavicella sp.]|uniref:GNAT family N-acetyltransferase n=1 Tax=Flavicella sp. TaxID=2957742 RepID=UPI0030180C46
MIEIRKISVCETYEIRKDVLRENIQLTEKMDGDFDKDTIHLGAFINKELGCVASFMQHDSDLFTGSQYRLRGMATHKKHQYKGLGKTILMEAEKFLLTKHVGLLWCNARVFSLKFYEKSGYKRIGKEFDVEFVGLHFVMYKELKK